MDDIQKLKITNKILISILVVVAIAYFYSQHGLRGIFLYGMNMFFLILFERFFRKKLGYGHLKSLLYAIPMQLIFALAVTGMTSPNTFVHDGEPVVNVMELDPFSVAYYVPRTHEIYIDKDVIMAEPDLYGIILEHELGHAEADSNWKDIHLDLFNGIPIEYSWAVIKTKPWSMVPMPIHFYPTFGIVPFQLFFLGITIFNITVFVWLIRRGAFEIRLFGKTYVVKTRWSLKKKQKN